MRTDRIKEQWEDFYDQVLKPVRPSTIQVKEMRRAFYAGAEALCRITFDIAAIKDNNVCEEEMQGLDTELVAFADDVKAERA